MAKLLKNAGAVLMTVGALLAILQRTLPALAVAEMAGRANGVSPIVYVLFRTLDGPQALAFYLGAIMFGIAVFLTRRKGGSSR